MLAYLKIILRSFLFRKKRTFLTVLGITIGTTLILTLILLGEGLEKALASQLQAFGGDLVYIFPGDKDDPLGGILGGGEIRDRDLEIVKEVDGVDLMMGMQFKNFNVEFEGQEEVINVNGSPWMETRVIFEGSQGFELSDGEWPTRDSSNQVLIGSIIADDRFDIPPRAGDEILIGNKRFLVSGVLEPIGNPDDDSRIWMSLDRYRAVSGDTTGVAAAIVKVAPGYDPRHVADDIQYAVDRQRGAQEMVAFTSENALDAVGNVLGVVQLILAAFAAVALLVGGIGIMNTMFTSVLERTREVGVMKALGSTDNGILTLFLMESGLLGTVGGILGIMISFAFAKAIEFGAARQDLEILKITFDPVIVVASLIFTFVVGAIFGAIPAMRAARLKPTEALRYE